MAVPATRALNARLAGLLAALALALAAPACDESASPVLGDAGMGALEIGSGELAFAPLEDGEVLPYVAGSQGGHHVFVSFRVQGLDPLRVLIEVTTEVEREPDLVLTRRGRQNFNPTTPDAGAASVPSHDYAGWPAQILDAPLHVGEEARIDVLLEDRAGRTARASKTIVIGRAQ